MSRILKYRESLQRFIKEKSCFSEDKEINEENINNYISEVSKENDLIIPILSLTVMNNQNKKHHVSMQGYYVAATIEFILILTDLMEKREDYIKKNSIDSFIKLQNKLINYAERSLHQNLESIKNIFGGSTMLDIVLTALNIHDSSLNTIIKTINNKIITENKNCNEDVINWYLKTDKESIDKFKQLKFVSKESLKNYIQQKYTMLCELAIIYGYILGGGDIKDISQLKKQAKHFSMMYKISKDFETLETDLKNSTFYTLNYILNNGLQDSYEMFLSSKQKFIEEAMIQDTYTNTIKEIMDIMESKVDIVIDQTSPDLKSNYSSSKN